MLLSLVLIPTATNANQPIHMVYVPSHLYHMLFELFKVRRLPSSGEAGRVSPWPSALAVRVPYCALHPLPRMPCGPLWKATSPASLSPLSRLWWPWVKKICPSKYVALDLTSGGHRDGGEE